MEHENNEDVVQAIKRTNIRIDTLEETLKEEIKKLRKILAVGVAVLVLNLDAGNLLELASMFRKFFVLF